MRCIHHVVAVELPINDGYLDIAKVLAELLTFFLMTAELTDAMQLSFFIHTKKVFTPPYLCINESMSHFIRINKEISLSLCGI